MSDQLEWAKIAASLVGGGLVGALITNAVTVYRSRIQPVGKRVEITPLFEPGFTGSTLSPVVTVTTSIATHQFTNLHVLEVQVINRGNRDFPTFSFGVTLTAGDSAVHVDPVTPDRHHIATLVIPITPDSPQSSADFNLKPFNRGDAYTLRIFIVASGTQPGAVSLSSAEPIRFTDVPSLTESLADIATSAAVNFGPFQLRLR